MNAKRYGKWLILWCVFDYDKDGNPYSIARFKNPEKAAMYALEHDYGGVEMELCKPEWNESTED